MKNINMVTKNETGDRMLHNVGKSTLLYGIRLQQELFKNIKGLPRAGTSKQIQVKIKGNYYPASLLHEKPKGKRIMFSIRWVKTSKLALQAAYDIGDVIELETESAGFIIRKG